MFPLSTVNALALAVVLMAPLNAAHAGSWVPTEIKRTPTGTDRAATNVSTSGACVWTRWRGWHGTGWLGTWHACQPGPAWRYERRCWIGPGNVRHCRFYG